MDQFIEGKFSSLINPKDEYAISKCKNAREQKVLEFLVSMLYLEKPTRVIITVDNTMFEALLGERNLD